MHRRYACLWRKIGADAVLTEPGAGACASPDILFSMFQQHNQALPGVKALTAVRLRKCRSRINQPVRDGCLEQYLAGIGVRPGKFSFLHSKSHFPDLPPLRKQPADDTLRKSKLN
jgi:hypothetical protein